MRVLWSSFREPAANAALEELLYRGDDCAGTTLLFYCNDQAVLFGRNQNPWQECNVSWCLQNDLTLMRRLSGGGTVYHDPGNLNYAFIMPRQDYDQERYLHMVVAALRQAGMPAMSMSSQFSLWNGQRKVAGTAFALNNRRALLHGCILVHSDLQHLRAALQLPPEWKYQAAGVPSVRAPVMTMAELLPEITTREVATLIAQQAITDKQEPKLPAIDIAEWENKRDFQLGREKFRGFAWTYGRTSDFTAQLACPAGQLHLQVSGGCISKAVLHGQQKDTEIAALQGVPMTISTEKLLEVARKNAPADEKGTNRIMEL